MRRLAWYSCKPMIKILKAHLQVKGLTMARVGISIEVRSKCRDKSICEECPFHTPAEENPTRTTALTQP